MARARIPDAEGWAAVDAARVALVAAGGTHAPSTAVPRPTLATAVRYSLQLLAERAKGNTVEVRVPPFAAIQCIEGPGHTRGTPPNVVEMDAVTWLLLAGGELGWEAGVAGGTIHASGQRADLRGFVPIAGIRPAAGQSDTGTAAMDDRR
ncbi:sterol carrier family protein [Subtercola boreus]|uniref:Bacterial SCP orthologue domain-containing protein n=1 Tax=Subtercola boreus TaxID=120213 RepID=A0A3E0W6D6_9MICO|nr:sterol carrier family protein [Subtercola boreus]RFA17954.1 hypothetical protein B7R24_14920 [Subtercola boreus]RFA18336.1 hypothetical protein B7R23_14955 [Subtercola boreus]RFA24866.1 hypothetical protein B7R25_14950 [Subtercola boreus]